MHPVRQLTFSRSSLVDIARSRHWKWEGAGIRFELNMHQRKHAITAVLVCFATIGVAHGQSPVRITLAQAIDLAIAHNHALKATQTQVQQSQAAEVTAGLRPNPNLTADVLFV